jgi:hypothetical protein
MARPAGFSQRGKGERRGERSRHREYRRVGAREENRCASMKRSGRVPLTEKAGAALVKTIREGTMGMGRPDLLAVTLYEAVSAALKETRG